jgi:hypothetical protein
MEETLVRQKEKWFHGSPEALLAHRRNKTFSGAPVHLSDVTSDQHRRMLAAEGEGVTGLSTISGLWALCEFLTACQIDTFGSLDGRHLCRVLAICPWESFVVNTEHVGEASTVNLWTKSNQKSKIICRQRQ